jgi:hypothetical protein
MTRARIAAVATCLALVLGASAWRLAHRNAAHPMPRLEVAGGDAGGLPRATPAEEHFDEAALAAALATARSENGAVFIVMRHGHVVVEDYGNGHDREMRVDAGGFAAALAALVAGAVGESGEATATGTAAGPDYAHLLSKHIWARLNAAPAWIELPRAGARPPTQCCFHARAVDWMRVANLLLDDGSFEGERLVAPTTARRLLATSFSPPMAASAAEPAAANDLVLLRGAGHLRLWLVPSLKLAVLFGAEAAAASAADAPRTWDEMRLPNQVIRAITDRPSQPLSRSALQQLVPGH